MTSQDTLSESLVLEDTLEKIVERIGDPVPTIYDALFKAHPASIPLFERTSGNRYKGLMVEQTLFVLQCVAEKDASIANQIQNSAFSHDGYGVGSATYWDFFPLVRDVFRETLGEDWSEAHETVWNSLLQRITDIAKELA